jgi:NADPH-dependent 2,4-dienoyl-CoA reductase/sulfur reductase-like enzyme
LKELVDDKSKFVGTIYEFNSAKKVAEMRKKFQGGKALFTQPPMPVKCAGAPQKMAYLCDDYWKKNGVKAEVHFYTPLPQMFGVKYYSDALEIIAKNKGIGRHYNTVLIKVREGVATFRDNATNKEFEENFDFLHAVPSMNVPELLVNSPISNAAGMVDVGRDMRHKKYKNIWAIGDCIALPNAKTAAAVFSQAPVLVENLSNSLHHKNNKQYQYDGYSACPLFISKGNLLLAEFADIPGDKPGDVVKSMDESFKKNKQNLPSPLYYYITKNLTYAYKLALHGRWYGKNSFFDPIKYGDVRKFYIPALYSIPPLLLLLLFIL